LKKVHWVGSSRKDLKGFPDDVQDELGYALTVIQYGGKPDKAKPMKEFDGVMEIISDYDTNTYRAVYAYKLGDLIYILHAFQKKSKKGIKTPKEDLKLIRQRLKEARNHAETRRKNQNL